MAGFTTVRDVGAGDYIDVGLRNAIAAGKIPGPRMLVAVNALGATGGHCDSSAGFAPNIFGRETGITDGVINSPDQARLAVRYNIKYGADVIKTCATGGVLSLTDDVDTPQLTQAELDALVDEAHALRRKTAAHAHGATGAKSAIRAGIDSIEHGSFLDDEALDMMKARGTYYVPTLMAAEGLKERLTDGYLPPVVAAKARQAIAALDATVRKAIARGVKIVVGTDATVYPHGRNAEEFHLLVNLGMKPIDALKAGTSLDAELLGVADRTGSLEAGKFADIVACPGNPEENIRQVEKIRFVMKEGVIYRKARGLTRSGVSDLLILVCSNRPDPHRFRFYVVKFIAGIAGQPLADGTADSESPQQPVRWNPSAGVVRLGDADPLLYRSDHPLGLRPAPLRHHPHLLQAQEKADPANRRSASTSCRRVTIQLPLYNERYVVERLIEETVKMDYPKELLQIQVLDDSTDDTAPFADALVERYRTLGYPIEYHHRTNRHGFKAGALQEGLKSATGEMVAVFDADFIPPTDFLTRTIHYFTDPKVGVVQTRWSYLNRDYNFLTEVEGMLLDGHFILEHGARSCAGYFFNFNGTAGILRISMIADAGGWQHDTLTEDSDLSYRAQLKGWRFVYVPGLDCPSELPVEMHGFQVQQSRWAKGLTQVAMKLLPTILKAPISQAASRWKPSCT